MRCHQCNARATRQPVGGLAALTGFSCEHLALLAQAGQKGADAVRLQSVAVIISADVAPFVRDSSLITAADLLDVLGVRASIVMLGLRGTGTLRASAPTSRSPATSARRGRSGSTTSATHATTNTLWRSEVQWRC